MAGIGFELRRLLRKNTLLGLVEAYAYAGVIGSGPWSHSFRPQSPISSPAA
jgi:uncharacterized membrane protein